ncbi:CynX/NimT family MFS transporter [Bradyrhizobium sp. SYSU BS000235]|uniref:MFS transporter n=1 Tax=Bradyrhizobium sp. SYSU BS000235 TaxID=3411332 RepID=UPI003C75005E
MSSPIAEERPAPFLSQRWQILLVLYLARSSMAFQFQSVGSVGPFLIDGFGIDFTWLGTLIGLYMLPGAVVALPSGLIGQRFGARRAVIFGLFLMFAGGLMTASSSFNIVLAGRLISGVGGVILNVMMTKMVTDWFSGREIVFAMSVFVSSWPLGIALGLMTLPLVAGAWHWPAAMVLSAVLSLAGLVLMVMFYRDPPRDLDEPVAKFSMAMDSREWLLVSIAGLIWGVWNVGYIVLVSFLPELFTSRGYSHEDASRIVSLLGWALIIAVPVAGYIAQRVNRPNLLMTFGFGFVGLAALALPFISAFMTTFLLIALFAGLPAGLIMSLASQALSPQHRAIGMGVFYAFYYASMAILPALAGHVRDLSGSPASPSLFASGMMWLSLLGLIAFRVAQRWKAG